MRTSWISLAISLIVGNFIQAQETRFNNISSSTKPVFQVNFVYPTADKTQSKLFFMDSSWWVAATTNSKSYIWISDKSGNNWHSSLVLAEGIDVDNICTITLLKEGIGVIWSDQINDVVSMRIHKDEDPPGIRGEPELVDSENNTADNHLNTSLSPDGSLWVASKNSVDKAGKPQFVLLKHSVEGEWTNIPYLILENRMKRPSRPIVVVTEDYSYLYVGHDDNDRSIPYLKNSKIEFAAVPFNFFSAEQLNNPQPVIITDNTYKIVVRNITGSKNLFPKDAPWITLAGDAEGRVYEADLKKLIKV